MTDLAKSFIKVEVTELLKQFMAKEIDEKELIEKLYIIDNDHKRGDLGLWYRWHDGHPAAIMVGNIKADLHSARNRGHLLECIEATINDNSLVVNFS
jgi:hypothetical protein